ncbi:Uncharacterised protein [Nocardia cyriacigeorgica]|uniref:Uncharacterized protein n=1 Tax=Nocardia cyriacigeorgica TaxID=135487 RepID=A0A4V6IBR8_9NOCA|nr:Uncharacterised protein [Nocardia cyriacigeorgica]
MQAAQGTCHAYDAVAREIDPTFDEKGRSARLMRLVIGRSSRHHYARAVGQWPAPDAGETGRGIYASECSPISVVNPVPLSSR